MRMAGHGEWPAIAGVISGGYSIRSVVEGVGHGTHDEGEGVVLVGQAVLLQREGAPAVDTSQTHLGLVDQYIGISTLRNLRRVHLRLIRTVVKRLDGVVQRRC